MGTVTRQLVLNITTTNVWTQMLQGNGGAAYVIPSGGRGIVKSLTAMNLDSNSGTVEFAISTNSTIADAERVWPPITVPAGGVAQDEHNVTYPMQSLEGVWCRVVGTTPNATFRADVLELT